MAAETDKTGWTIDGVVYEDPDKFTTSEHRIIKRYTGLDFNALEKKTGEDLMGDQDFLAAMMHIAYRREHRDMSFDQIEDVIGDVDLTEAMSSLGGGEGDAADPPASGSTSKPDESSERNSTGSSESSGNGSSESSDPSEPTLSPITTDESGTSSLASAART